MSPKTRLDWKGVANDLTKLDEIQRRIRILDEHYLRRDIAREEALRREHPDIWREHEVARKDRNRAQAELNRRLREAGCRPVAPSLSLQQKMKKLQQLEARNRAEIAILKKRPRGFPKKSARHGARSGHTGG